MLRELFEANEEGHRKALTSDHFDTIFDAVAHQELDMERIKEMSHELGDGEDYDRTKGGAYFAMMRMYAVCHGAPPDGDIIGSWWKDVPPGFIEYAEDHGIHNARENVVKATGIAEHKVKQQHEAKGAAKAGKARANKLMAAKKNFEDRWPTIRATLNPQSVRKAVELAKNEILNDMADGQSVHVAVGKVVAKHGGVMESAKWTFINFLVEGVVDAKDRFAAKKTGNDKMKKATADKEKRTAQQKANDKKHQDAREARGEERQPKRGDKPKRKLSIVEGDVISASDRFAKKPTPAPKKKVERRKQDRTNNSSRAANYLKFSHPANFDKGGKPNAGNPLNKD